MLTIKFNGWKYYMNFMLKCVKEYNKLMWEVITDTWSPLHTKIMDLFTIMIFNVGWAIIAIGSTFVYSLLGPDEIEGLNSVIDSVEEYVFG